jgi:hypothetical protein
VFPILLHLTVATVAFAPAPIARDTTTASANWGLAGMHTVDMTLTLKRDGKEEVFKVSKNLKVTINGQQGYAFLDVYDCGSAFQPKVKVMLKDGIAVALEVKLSMKNGEKLWAPGAGPMLAVRRRVDEDFRRYHEQQRQGK